nr:MAG TPA: hypothetical protein [Caudoviricetes sp.]
MNVKKQPYTIHHILYRAKTNKNTKILNISTLYLIEK